MTDLPIEHILVELKRALIESTGVVLQAPPGAGKTTRVPLALLDEPWLAGKRIVMLEPRRLAARAAARRMATTLGESVGATVGYRMRMDTVVGPRTRIEVVTEGVLTRMLQSDPALENIGLVIFDEFHERSLQADLGLALTLQSRALLREDLRVLVMSATLDGEAVATLLGGAPIVTSEGRSHPVETRYLDRPREGRIEPATAAAVRTALRRDAGDILVFLPGVGEIRRVESLLGESSLDAGTVIAPLHGSLPQREQDRAIEPARTGERKVVLSTSIAETSLTIEGIRVVIDCGLIRAPRFSPRSGMTRLETITVTRASADQRRGRAGRLGPGICYRLWTELEQGHLLPHNTPEILEADLAPLALDLAEWGVTDPSTLAWIDPPPTAGLAQARALLTQLGALDPEGIITPHGRRMASLPLHPRLAQMMLRGIELGHGGLACDIAALLGERDPLLSDGGPPDADLRLRLDALRGDRTAGVHGHRVNEGAIRTIRTAARFWRERMKIGRDKTDDLEAAGLLLAFAYPDRIAQMRPGQPDRYLLRNGRAALLPTTGALTGVAYLVAAELDGAQRESRIFLAAPLELDDIEHHFTEQIEEETVVSWESEARAVRARRRERLGAMILREIPVTSPDSGIMARALIEGIRIEGFTILPWSKAARALLERILFLRTLDPSWPDVSDDALLSTLDEWLAPHLAGMSRLADLQRLDLTSILLDLLSWSQRAALDELAPTHLTVPSGSRIPIDYSDPAAPVLAVRLQEMFGALETPRIARGVVPVTLHLLSPANRPVQVTRDLASFWRGTYFDVRKDLKGRYPKHHWPDNPLDATPTNRAKRRG